MRRLLLIGGLLFAAWGIAALAAPQAFGCAFSVTPTAYDPPADRAAHLTGLELAGYNMIAPDDQFFGIPTVETGIRTERSVSEAPYVPPTLLKAVGWIESSIAQSDWNTPFGAVGPALVSFDCGYGIMQITSGMTAPLDAGWPSIQQALVATHYLFDIGRGSAILVDKWNGAPQVRPIAGTDTASLSVIVENWYFATWSYNGFTGPGANRSNHPSDPNYAWPRTGFSCGALDDGYGHRYGDYPYQELVFGCVARPPSVNGQELWTPLPLSLPDLDDPLWADPLSLESWYACNSREPDSGCTAFDMMDMPSPQPFHVDPTERPSAEAAAAAFGSPVLAMSHGVVDELVTEVTIYNVGTGILAWRAQHEQDWFAIDKQAGVALSSDVVCSPDSPCERSPTLTISIAPALAPTDGTVGWIDVVSLTTAQLWRVRVDPPPVTPGATATALPTATATSPPTPTSTPTPPPVIGDVNCSSTADSIDASLVLQFGAGLIDTLACFLSGDANEDGAINVLDAALILQFVGGLIDTLPPPRPS